ncbi:N-acetyltransferase [Actinomyces ruminis]|uniref:N-acetyltransferase n=1 Tax=Actinomyces ruminis TaxID=1937003 RepID=A0ABX4M9X5_9ACTO|nr:N-acetyltransferase [Actinomyces ruminis]
MSKVYVDARLRASGIAPTLLAEAVCDAATMGVTALWLGTNDANRRAQKAYRRAGFRKVGTRTYEVGGRRCRDVVMALNPQETAA